MKRLLPGVQIREGGPCVSQGAGAGDNNRFGPATRMRMSKQFQARELFKKYGEIGCLGLTKPEEYGGSGLDASAGT